MIIYSPPHPPKSIPVVDLSGGFSPDASDRKKVAWEIHKACRETGFFYISNHRVPRALIDAQFVWAKRFFALSLEQKLAIHLKNSPSMLGYAPIEGQALDSQDENSEKAPPDLKESFACAMGLEHERTQADGAAPGSARNQWPSAMPGFLEQMKAYHATMRDLGDRVLAMLALSLELPEDYFLPYYDRPGSAPRTRILRYPPHPESAGNQLGAGAHTDWGAVTLLVQDELGGLEVRNAAGEWIQATPVPETFVINLGDLMQRWTNDLYHSTMHRVKNNSSTRDRYSVAYFYGPRPDSRIECMPTCTDAEHLPKYPPCTASEHVYEMFRRSYGYAPVS